MIENLWRLHADALTSHQMWANLADYHRRRGEEREATWADVAAHGSRSYAEALRERISAIERLAGAGGQQP